MSRDDLNIEVVKIDLPIEPWMSALAVGEFFRRGSMTREQCALEDTIYDEITRQFLYGDQA